MKGIDMSPELKALNKLVLTFPGSPILHINPDHNRARCVVDFGNPRERPFCTSKGWADLEEALRVYLKSEFPNRDVEVRIDKARGIYHGGTR